MPSQQRPWPSEASDDRRYALDAAQVIQHIAADAKFSVMDSNKLLAMAQLNDAETWFYRISTAMSNAGDVRPESGRWPSNMLHIRQKVEAKAREGRGHVKIAEQAMMELHKEMAYMALSAIESVGAEIEYLLKQAKR